MAAEAAEAVPEPAEVVAVRRMRLRRVRLLLVVGSLPRLLVSQSIALRTGGAHSKREICSESLRRRCAATTGKTIARISTPGRHRPSGKT